MGCKPETAIAMKSPDPCSVRFGSLWETSVLFSAQLGKVSKTFPVSFPTGDISQHPVGPHGNCLVQSGGVNDAPQAPSNQAAGDA